VNYQLQSGLPITRTITVATCTASITTNCVNQANANNSNVIHAVPRGSSFLPSLGQLDLRAGKVFRFGSNSVEVDMDVYNVMNSNTTFSVRTGSTTTSVVDYSQASHPTVSIPIVGSPSGIPAPADT